MFEIRKAANLDQPVERPKASLAALKLRYGYRDDGSKKPFVVTIQGAKVERWERLSGELFAMVTP